MSNSVLDASAVLALLQQEKGHGAIERLLLAGPCDISTVNMTEIMTKLVDNGLSLSEASAAVSLHNLRPHPFDVALAQIAVSLRPVTRPLGLSLGDRACLALARGMGSADVYTADSAWEKLSITRVSIHIIR